MHIGVIDTGVDKNHKRLYDANIELIILNTDGENQLIEENQEDEYGHGTGIVSIINSHLTEGNFKVIKIGGANPNSQRLLIKALKILTEDPNVVIINVSMGIKTDTPSEELTLAVKRAIEAGKIIVASTYYDYRFSCYPASFAEVFGVGSGYVRDKKDFRYLPEGASNVLAKGGFQRVPVPGNQYRFSVGTSLATAHFTGIIADAYKQGAWTDCSTLKTWLIKHSKENIYSLTKHDQPVLFSEFQSTGNRYCPEALYERLNIQSPLNRIGLFPVEEKELRSIAENQLKLSGEINLLISYPRTLKKVHTDRAVLHRLPTKKEIENTETLIVGSFTDQQSDYNTVFAIDLIKCFLENHKNIVTWDESVYKIIEDLKKNYSGTQGIIELISFNRRKMKLLYEQVPSGLFDEVPTLCVIGTNKQQGKFTVQLRLKQILEQAGYSVGHISSEPQGALLGADFTFPFGHNSTVSVPVNEWYHVLNMLKKVIRDTKHSDIILTGSQSGIIPRHPTFSSLPPQKLIYTNAFYPDALVCTISPSDEIEFIHQTVNTVKAFNSCEVLFYCLTPYDLHTVANEFGTRIRSKKITPMEYSARRAYFENKLGKPVFDITQPENHHQIIQLIQKHYKNESKSAS